MKISQQEWEAYQLSLALRAVKPRPIKAINKRPMISNEPKRLVRVRKGVYKYTDLKGQVWDVLYNELPNLKFWTGECKNKGLRRDTKKEVISQIDKLISEK